MLCCNSVNRSTARVFDRVARCYQWCYHHRGPDRTQRQLIAALEDLGLRGCSLLEVGCGVGYLQRLLLRRGASRAVGVELSEGMLELARSRAQAEGLAGRTEYRLGDFVELAPGLEPADLVILDRSICCYPDAQAMLGHALDRARRGLALIFPRAHRFNRVAVATGDWLLRRLGVDYRAYIHDPERLRGQIAAGGFVLGSAHRSLGWHTEVYVRGPA